jgi:hypothetical protein
MALDDKARKIALNFPGGSLTATRGLLEAVFGVGLTGAGQRMTESSVSVSGHSRTRVIGGSSTNVAASSYTRKKYPTTVNGGAAGGEAVALLVGGRYWTARLSGSHQDFAAFLAGADFYNDHTLFWRSEKGTQYGPFGGSVLASL